MTTKSDPLSRDETSSGRRGTNQAGMRAQNERLVLSLVRRHDALAKTEIARITGLSAQTVSVIMRHLEADGLLRRGEPKRGRVGQPSVPLSLDPNGAFFVGAKVGRRSLEVVLVDFTGDIRRRSTSTYDFPRPADTLERLLAEVRLSERSLGGLAGRIAGVGIAMPFELWAWAEEIGAPDAAMAAWREADLAGGLAEHLPYPVYVQNDATAACGAELAFGISAHVQDFIYFYVGTFIGGGVVLNGSLHVGRTGNAGALGSMPVPGPNGTVDQLIDQASLVLLERRLRADGIDAAILYRDGADWTVLGTRLDEWLKLAAEGLAHAIVAAASVIDFEATVIDGAFPADVQTRLIGQVRQAISRLDTSGIDVPVLRAGSIGPIARALGGASLPLFDRYLVDPRFVAALPQSGV